MRKGTDHLTTDQLTQQLSYPHNYLSPRSLPSCLTIQFYSFNQLLFPVIIFISVNTNQPFRSYSKSMNLVIHLFAICLYKHVFHFNKLVSQSFKHNSTNRRLSDSVFSACYIRLQGKNRPCGLNRTAAT